jgi:hypothetical protein
MNQNINHVDHVIWASYPETLVENVARLAELTGRPLQGPYERRDVGVSVYLSWEGGIEILSPLDVETPTADALRSHLDTKGEGLFAIVFGVPDIAEARTRAERLGYQPGDQVENRGDAPWEDKTEVMKEVVVGNFMNSLFIFGEIVFKDGIFVTTR